MSPNYRYKVVNGKGQKIEGSIVRENEHSAAAALRDQGYYITKLTLEEEATSVTEKFSNFANRVKTKDLAIFCRQIATMIEAGVPLMSCLNALSEQTENKRLKQGIKGVKESVASGGSLAHSMEDYPKIFPELMISMVRAGEIGGILDEVLNRLALQFEKEYKLQEKIKSAMTYPSVIGIVSICIVVFLLVRVVPMFTQVFTNMDLNLPLPTRLLLELSGSFKRYWYLIIMFILVVIWGIKKYIGSEKGGLKRDKLLLSLPVINNVIKKVIIARFSRTLSTLLSGGIPILQSLAAVEKTAGNKVISRALAAAQAKVSHGVGLAKPLEESGVFPSMVIEMISIGEESGALDTMLNKVADFYEVEAEFVLSRISSIIEPVMIILMSVIVGGIVTAILLPMFDLINMGG